MADHNPTAGKAANEHFANARRVQDTIAEDGN